MTAHAIRTIGDPVLRQVAREITDIDGRLVRLVDDMFDTLYRSENGIGLAAPQIGVEKRLFIWDMDDEPRVIINPRITGSDGEWWYSEGCLSIPGLHFDICRPKVVEVSGIDLDGNEVSFEADELFGRLMQHEIDHLDGVLMTEHLADEQLAEAKKAIRELQMAAPADPGSGLLNKFRLR